MKKWLVAAGLGLAMAASAQAADKIAIVNMGSLFQQVAQKTGVSSTLENEFKGRAGELQRMEGDLTFLHSVSLSLRKHSPLSRIASVALTKNVANWLLVSRLQ